MVSDLKNKQNQPKTNQNKQTKTCKSSLSCHLKNEYLMQYLMFSSSYAVKVNYTEQLLLF